MKQRKNKREWKDFAHIVGVVVGVSGINRIHREMTDNGVANVAENAEVGMASVPEQCLQAA